MGATEAVGGQLCSGKTAAFTLETKNPRKIS